jgi:hypothetical protein
VYMLQFEPIFGNNKLCESRWEITKISMTVLFCRKGWDDWGTMDGNEISCAPRSIIAFHGILFPICVVIF